MAGEYFHRIPGVAGNACKLMNTMCLGLREAHLLVVTLTCSRESAARTGCNLLLSADREPTPRQVSLRIRPPHRTSAKEDELLPKLTFLAKERKNASEAARMHMITRVQIYTAYVGKFT